MADQIQWMLAEGGLDWSVKPCADKAGLLYGRADSRGWAQPFLTEPGARSTVVCTIDLDDVSANDVSAGCGPNGVLDTETYRKLGRNQMGIATFPAVELADVERLTACTNHVVEQLT